MSPDIIPRMYARAPNEVSAHNDTLSKTCLRQRVPPVSGMFYGYGPAVHFMPVNSCRKPD